MLSQTTKAPSATQKTSALLERKRRFSVISPTCNSFSGYSARQITFRHCIDCCIQLIEKATKATNHGRSRRKRSWRWKVRCSFGYLFLQYVPSVRSTQQRALSRADTALCDIRWCFGETPGKEFISSRGRNFTKPSTSLDFTFDWWTEVTTVFGLRVQLLTWSRNNQPIAINHHRYLTRYILHSRRNCHRETPPPVDIAQNVTAAYRRRSRRLEHAQRSLRRLSRWSWKSM